MCVCVCFIVSIHTFTSYWARDKDADIPALPLLSSLGRCFRCAWVVVVVFVWVCVCVCFIVSIHTFTSYWARDKDADIPALPLLSSLGRCFRCGWVVVVVVCVCVCLCGCVCVCVFV